MVWPMFKAFNSTELNSTSESKSCWSRATVEPAKHGSSTTFETGLSGCLHVREKNNPFEEWDCSLSEIAIFILFDIKTASLQGEQISRLRIRFQSILLPQKYHSKFDRFAICALCFFIVSLVETATSDWTDIYSLEIRHTYIYFCHTMLFQF